MARTEKKNGSGRHFAACVRVSTASQTNAQTYENQVEALRNWSRAYGHRLTFFKDLGESGLKSDRPQFTAMMARLRDKGCFDGVVVQKLDRLGRSTIDLLVTVAEFDRLGLAFVSLGDAIDTGCPQGRLTLAIFAALCEYERSLIVERLKTGRERAERAGKCCHRPQKAIDMNWAEFYLSKGVGVTKTARILGVSPNTLRARLTC